MKPLAAEFKTSLIFLLIAISIFLLDSLNFLNPVKILTNYLTTPLQTGIYQTAVNLTDQFNFILDLRTASKENKALKTQLAALLLENNNLRNSLSQTQALVEQQSVISPTTYNMLSAQVIGLSRYLILNKGEQDGIKIGMPVVYKDFLLGQIKEVSIDRSKVILTSDPDSKISSLVVNKNGKTKGLLTGQFGQELLLDKILHQEPIEVGDIVYSEGQDTIIAKGLVLGTVSEVLSRDNQVFKQAKVRPVLDSRNLDIVFIITN